MKIVSEQAVEMKEKNIIAPFVFKKVSNIANVLLSWTLGKEEIIKI